MILHFFWHCVPGRLKTLLPLLQQWRLLLNCLLTEQSHHRDINFGGQQKKSPLVKVPLLVKHHRKLSHRHIKCIKVKRKIRGQELLLKHRNCPKWKWSSTNCFPATVKNIFSSYMPFSPPLAKEKSENMYPNHAAFILHGPHKHTLRLGWSMDTPKKCSIMKMSKKWLPIATATTILLMEV